MSHQTNQKMTGQSSSGQYNGGGGGPYNTIGPGTAETNLNYHGPNTKAPP